MYLCWLVRGAHVAQWAKRAPLKLEVPSSNPRGLFNGCAGNRDPFRWLETAWGLSHIRLIWRVQYFPGDWPLPYAFFRCLSEETLSLLAGHATFSAHRGATFVVSWVDPPAPVRPRRCGLPAFAGKLPWGRSAGTDVRVSTWPSGLSVRI